MHTQVPLIACVATQDDRISTRCTAVGAPGDSTLPSDPCNHYWQPQISWPNVFQCARAGHATCLTVLLRDSLAQLASLLYLAPILLAHKHPIHPTHAHAYSYACVSRRRGRVRGGGGVGLLYRGRFRRAPRGREEQERQSRALHRLSLPADQGPLCHSECASTTDLKTPCDGNHLYRTTLCSEVASATLFDIVFRPVAQWASSTFPSTARA